MKLLTQLGLVCGLYWLSYGIERLLPFAFPASVISLLLILVLLLLRLLPAKSIRETAEFLTGNMGFFFLPAATSIMNYANTIFENAAAFFTICVVSMLTTFAATAWTVTLTKRLMRRGEGAK